MRRCICVSVFMSICASCAHAPPPPPSPPTPTVSCDGIALHEVELAPDVATPLEAGDTVTLRQVDHHPTLPEAQMRFVHGDQTYDWVMHESAHPTLVRGYCVRVARIVGDVPTLAIAAVPSAH